MLVKGPKNAKHSLRLYRLPTIHTPILTLGKVANNADQFLRLCRLPTIHMPMLTPVQAPDNSHANPYTCEVPGQGASLVPPGIPGASHFNELHPQKESCGASRNAPTRFVDDGSRNHVEQVAMLQQDSVYGFVDDGLRNH
ncbi:hypothetical protein O181_122830 [Austropuccinia psidii MF-1]|uniref:Uncharacterized protein n=1 Tax=Austropuccinia psidii MF-1 TaxID=1389203 RepID=A0A9Q3Q3N7_9BASI|nr:hypothetical protein [Austropuccinia psidii MF-1]